VSRPQAAQLTRRVDALGVEHFAYHSARRTLCLQQLAADCSTTAPATATCPTCARVRQQLKRATTLGP
jgi:hypothetical protein